MTRLLARNLRGNQTDKKTVEQFGRCQVTKLINKCQQSFLYKNIKNNGTHGDICKSKGNEEVARDKIK